MGTEALKVLSRLGPSLRCHSSGVRRRHDPGRTVSGSRVHPRGKQREIAFHRSRMMGRCEHPAHARSGKPSDLHRRSSAAERGVAPRDSAGRRLARRYCQSRRPTEWSAAFLSAKAKGPGAFGAAGGGVTPIATRAADRGAIAHALSRGARQQTTRTGLPVAATCANGRRLGRAG